MERQTYVIARVKQAFDDLEGLEQRLRDEPETLLAASLPPAAISRSLPGEDSPALDSSAHEERLRLLEAGRRGLAKVRTAGESPPSLTPEETVGLEAIVLLVGRPALLIQEGRFAPPPGEWSVLEAHRAVLEAAIRRVGRIEVPGHLRMA